MSELNSLPPYMRILYNKIYAEKNISGLLDDERIVKLFHFGLKKKIMKDLLRDISKNAHVLQIGLTFGDEIECIYQKIRKQGKLDIFDVSEKQISRAKEKYARKNIEVINYNAALSWDEKYDVVICYNLLHELPLKTRRQVMDNVLAGLTTGGKAIFIDYAKQHQLVLSGIHSYSFQAGNTAIHFIDDHMGNLIRFLCDNISSL